jgi:hypothetical protein
MIASMLSVPAAALLTAYLLLRFTASERHSWRLYELVLLWQSLYWTGAFILYQMRPVPPNAAVLAIAAGAQISCTTGALIAMMRDTGVRVRPPRSVRPMELRIVIALGVVSGAITLFYIVAILTNERLLGLLVRVVAGSGEFLNYRLTMSGGEAIYLAPGYVKQFRDVLLPSVVILLSAYAPKEYGRFAAMLAIIGALGGILSGERSVPMLHAFVIGAAVIMRRPSGHSRSWRVPLLTTGVVLVVFALVTVLLGRADASQDALTLFAFSMGKLFDRIVLTVPRENAGVFTYWGPMAPTWGRSWMGDLAGILPGVQHSFDSTLHEILGGSPRGASVLGLSSDMYLAWGMMGIATLPFAYMIFLHKSDQLLLRSTAPFGRVLRLVLTPLTFNWYSPFMFSLNGGVVLIGMVSALVLLHTPSASAKASVPELPTPA